MHDGARSNETHVAEQNIQNLRQFIQACPPKEGA